YLSGFGVTKDVTEGFKWIQKAAESGVVQAQYNLGKMYRDGDGVKSDREASAKWFLAAAEQGYHRAQNHVGVRLYRGEGIAKNEVEALKWLILAANSGNELAVQNRKDISAKLTVEQRADAEARAKAWKPSVKS
ncbi:MAG: hypothetical protein K0Q70_1041, partial [Rhodospirillales bacterium]|nr:hypothetical protein [Rhodospirillales bacterium]